jgi:GTP-binding protein YchF
MKVGIVGFSQSGKSTLFQALTGAAPDPSAGLKGQIGVAAVEDSRLDFLTEMYKPKKRTPTKVDFIDTPGLIRGEKADNPQRLATLRNADGLLVVLDGFSSDESPAGQLQRFREELLFADFEVVSNRIEKLEAGSKKPKPQAERDRDAKELADFKAMAARLEAGETLVGMDLSKELETSIKSFQLFSLKPELVVLNAREDRATAAPDSTLLALNSQVVVAAAKLELDLAQLEGDDRTMFMAELGVKELAKERIIQAAYSVVGLISFLTAGEDECRAWTIRRNTPAVEAAGKIHSDIQKGFIRAEVVAFDDLKRLGSMKEVRAKGLQRLEGKEYVVQDGDIINFRHNS